MLVTPYSVSNVRGKRLRDSCLCCAAVSVVHTHFEVTSKPLTSGLSELPAGVLIWPRNTRKGRLPSSHLQHLLHFKPPLMMVLISGLSECQQTLLKLDRFFFYVVPFSQRHINSCVWHALLVKGSTICHLHEWRFGHTSKRCLAASWSVLLLYYCEVCGHKVNWGITATCSGVWCWTTPSC